VGGHEGDSGGTPRAGHARPVECRVVRGHRKANRGDRWVRWAAWTPRALRGGAWMLSCATCRGVRRAVQQTRARGGGQRAAWTPRALQGSATMAESGGRGLVESEYRSSCGPQGWDNMTALVGWLEIARTVSGPCSHTLGTVLTRSTWSSRHRCSWRFNDHTAECATDGSLDGCTRPLTTVSVVTQCHIPPPRPPPHPPRTWMSASKRLDSVAAKLRGDSNDGSAAAPPSPPPSDEGAATGAGAAFAPRPNMAALTSAKRTREWAAGGAIGFDAAMIRRPTMPERRAKWPIVA
jgi:hypothetical protein